MTRTLGAGRSRCTRWIGATILAAATTGCAVAPPDAELRQQAEMCVRHGARYPENAAVRAQAMETAQEVLGPEACLLIQEGLRDEHPGVRFASCVALGKLGDADSAERIRPLTQDLDASVRVGACFAMEKLGDPSYRRAWVQTLREDPAPEVRRNAALTLGLLGDDKVIPLLARASLEDVDDGVRLQATEAMALLGDQNAISQFIRDSFGGIGFRQPFALMLLGRIKDPRVIGALRSRLASAPYLEAQLAAAHGLGMQGYDDGYRLALNSLQWKDVKGGMPDDPPENQIMRVRSMAALALGAIGDRGALGPLHQMMVQPDDPRLQLAAARAILTILQKSPAEPATP